MRRVEKRQESHNIDSLQHLAIMQKQLCESILSNFFGSVSITIAEQTQCIKTMPLLIIENCNIDSSVHTKKNRDI